MCEDDNGTPFRIITSKQYLKRAEQMANKGMVDITMDFMGASHLEMKESKITKPDAGEA